MRYDIEFLLGPWPIAHVKGQRDFGPEDDPGGIMVLERVPQIEADLERLTGLRVHIIEAASPRRRRPSELRGKGGCAALCAECSKKCDLDHRAGGDPGEVHRCQAHAAGD